METQHIIIGIGILIMSGIIAFFANVIRKGEKRKEKGSKKSTINQWFFEQPRKEVEYMSSENSLESIQKRFYKIFPWIREIEQYIQNGDVMITNVSIPGYETSPSYLIESTNDPKDQRICRDLIKHNKHNVEIVLTEIHGVKNRFCEKAIYEIGDVEILNWLYRMWKITSLVRHFEEVTIN